MSAPAHQGDRAGMHDRGRAGAETPSSAHTHRGKQAGTETPSSAPTHPTETYSRPAPARLSDAQLTARIRAVADAGQSTSLADLLTDGVVRLRTWRPEDAPAIVNGLKDGSAAYWIVGMPHPYGPVEAADFLSRAQRDLQSAEYAHLAVTDAQTGRVLGAIGMNFRHDRQAGEIGYWTHPDERRRGVARRAVALITGWAFTALLLPRVELIIHPLNYESQVIASRSGFRREGLLRSYLEHRGLRNDYYSFARLPHDPPPRPYPDLELTLPTLADPEHPSQELIRVHLRAWRMTDVELAVAMINADPEIYRWCLGIPSPCDVEVERAWVAQSARLWHEDAAPNFAIVGERQDGTEALLGSIGASPGPAPGGVEIGYFVDAAARCRGLATAALQAITYWALSDGSFGTCELSIHPENVASQHVAQRAGYEPSGETGLQYDHLGRQSLREIWRYSHTDRG